MMTHTPDRDTLVDHAALRRAVGRFAGQPGPTGLVINPAGPSIQLSLNEIPG